MMMLVNENDSILHKEIPFYDFSIMGESDLTELSSIIDNMFIVMNENHGIGLAAPQVGLSLRIFVMKIHDQQYECINPEIIDKYNNIIVQPEGCLSFPLLTLKIARPERVYVQYTLRDGKSITQWLDGHAARCFQHELDHLNGITFDMLSSKLSLKLANEKRRKLLTKYTRRSYE